jgi:hypothetical protein
MSLPGDENPNPQWQRPQQPPSQGWQRPDEPDAPADPLLQPWQQPGYQWQPSPPTTGSATAALILGICGIVLCPLILSVPALIFGYKARGEIERSGGRIGGGGMALAGIILGWIGTALGVLFLLLVVVGMSTG